MACPPFSARSLEQFVFCCPPDKYIDNYSSLIHHHHHQIHQRRSQRRRRDVGRSRRESGRTQLQAQGGRAGGADTANRRPAGAGAGAQGGRKTDPWSGSRARARAAQAPQGKVVSGPGESLSAVFLLPVFDFTTSGGGPGLVMWWAEKKLLVPIISRVCMHPACDNTLLGGPLYTCLPFSLIAPNYRRWRFLFFFCWACVSVWGS